ncbi:glycosyltransferase family 4 protein [Myroides odoratimimus]|uniref:glycosyltransferase family 4 protein n=1 Tax=Myroides odoratimimus TaxID=76832 RepID=UPI0025785296|nr:glycosyltransferase family 4 protein [Myroides odoratimimus]MDM1444008.1 glycosyltransferase family 4 protein [Myroides odoratimimus]
MEKGKVFLVSNMYPNKDYPYYGIFVENFSKMISNSDSYKVSGKAVIRGKSSGVFEKIINYIFFFSQIIIKGLFTSYDIIYVHYFKYSIYPTFFLKVLFRGKKLVYNFHGSDLIKDNADSFELSSFKIRILRKSDAIVVPSLYYKELIISKIPEIKEKLFVSPSGGVNKEVFHPISEFKFNECITLGYIGRLDVRKGVELFISSLSDLKQKKYDFNAFIVGNGTLRDEYLHMVDELNLKDEVVFIDSQPQKRLCEFYNMFDLLIFPTYRKSESLGLVGLEALSCGTPVLGTEIGEIKNYLEEGVNGFLFKERDINELTSKIIHYKRLSIEEKRKMRREAELSSADYETKKVQEKILIFLDSL